MIANKPDLIQIANINMNYAVLAEPITKAFEAIEKEMARQRYSKGTGNRYFKISDKVSADKFEQSIIDGLLLPKN